MARILQRLGILALALALAACVAPPTSVESVPGLEDVPRANARAFVDVVGRVEPIAEQECRTNSPQLNCDFLIVVDDSPGAVPNAFQTLDENGRPIIAFTASLREFLASHGCNFVYPYWHYRSIYCYSISRY